MPGEVVDLNPYAEAQGDKREFVLVQTDIVKITQIFIPGGSSIPTYEAAGQIILHCLDGRIVIAAREESHELATGQLLYLTANEPFSIYASSNAVLLATVVSPKQGPMVELIGGK